MHALSKIFLLLGFALTAMCLPVIGQEGEEEAGKLPDGAELVLGKMKQFEAQTLLEAQVKIEKKRLDVIRYLEKLMGEETRSGNLDGALAIRKEIGLLKAMPSAKLPTEEKPVATADKGGKEIGATADDQHPVIGRWAFKDKNGADLVREFTPEGKCEQFRGGRKEWTLNYEVVNDREVDVIFLGALKFRHTVRGNDTLKIVEPDAIAEREKPEEETDKEQE